jgi:dUTP pyrophosphatase
MSVILSKQDILSLVAAQPPLIDGCINLAEQVQPNGCDLTFGTIAALDNAGTIAVSNVERVISGNSPLQPDAAGFFHLEPGSYVITFNEIVSLPKDVMALGQPRSSLLRCGVTVHMAVWDAGYSGRGQALLTVYNPHGFKLQKDARVAQLVFVRLSSETEGYNGHYQGENLSR